MCKSKRPACPERFLTADFWCSTIPSCLQHPSDFGAHNRRMEGYPDGKSRLSCSSNVSLNAKLPPRSRHLSTRIGDDFGGKQRDTGQTREVDRTTPESERETNSNLPGECGGSPRGSAGKYSDCSVCKGLFQLPRGGGFYSLSPPHPTPGYGWTRGTSASRTHRHWPPTMLQVRLPPEVTGG